MVNAGFPLGPKHNSVLTFLTVGIPTFALALWARPGVPRVDLVRSMISFVLPAAFSIALVDLLVYLYFLAQNLPTGYANLPGGQMRAALVAAEVVARSGVTTASVLCGLLLVVFAEPPTEFWAGGAPVSGDWRPTILAGVLTLAYAAITAFPPTALFFELVVHKPLDYAALLGLVAVWAAGLRLSWRRNVVGRFLDADLP
jgi:cation-transporting ATPase E